MAFYDYINMASILLDIIFFSSLVNLMLVVKGEFSLPIDDKEEFDTLVDYSISIKTVIRIMIIAILFRVLKSLSIIRHKFPSFTILF